MHSIAIDLDGVLAHYVSGQKEQIGEPIKGAKEFLCALSKVARVIIHTARYVCDPHEIGEIHAWLSKENMYYDEIWTEPGKPRAVAYVDDRGISIPANAANFQLVLIQVNELLRSYDANS